MFRDRQGNMNIHVKPYGHLEETLRTLVNGSWDAVRISTLDVYPDGAASRANTVPTVPFAPAPEYGRIAEASGCYAETIERAEDLPDALVRALQVIRREKRQVVLDVKIGMDDGEK